MLKVFGKSILNGVFEQIHLLTKKYLKYQNTKYSICSISNTYLKYKYFKYCPPLAIPLLASNLFSVSRLLKTRIQFIMRICDKVRQGRYIVFRHPPPFRKILDLPLTMMMTVKNARRLNVPKRPQIIIIYPSHCRGGGCSPP